MTVAPEPLLHCTFCDKDQELVQKLIAGPGIYICDECVVRCTTILDESDPLVQLRAATARADALVEQLRDEGVPWEEIAAALRPRAGED